MTTTTQNTCVECNAPIPSPTHEPMYSDRWLTELYFCTPCATAFDVAEELRALERLNSDWEEEI